MLKKLLKLMTAAALTGFAAVSTAADSNFLADELRGLHSDLTSAHQWVDSDIRANLSHRWKTAPGRLTDVGLNFAEAKLEGVSWLTDVDLRQETDPDGKWTGFGASGTGLLWTGESFAFGVQPSAEWTDGGGGDSASFGVFGRRALGDWGVLGANVFGDYSDDGAHGDFSRWSLGADFQSALAEVRGNWYSGSAGFRERWSEDGRVFAYAPSGVDAELRLRWIGDSEWTGFAEYEKWDGRFGNADSQEVGYGLTYRPLGGGLLSGLQVDAGYRDYADSADGWNLRLGYSRVLGGDNYARKSDFGFGVRSALIASVERENGVHVESMTVRYQPFSAQARVYQKPLGGGLWGYNTPAYLVEAGLRCRLQYSLEPDATSTELSHSLLLSADRDSMFDFVCRKLRMGGDVNSRNMANLTPLHVAVGGNAVENVKLLLYATANVALTNNAGRTALDRAQMKYAEWTTPEQRATAQTIAMLLRAEGAACESQTGSLCTIDYEAIYPDEHPRPPLTSRVVTVYTDATGVVHQVQIPGVDVSTLDWQVRSNEDLFTIYADGRISLLADAELVYGQRATFGAYYHLPGERYRRAHAVWILVHIARVTTVWTKPQVRKTVPYYTGPLFTLTILGPMEKFYAGFGYQEEYIFNRNEHYTSGTMNVRWLLSSPPRVDFISRDRGMRGVVNGREIVMWANRQVSPARPIVDDVRAYVYYENYPDEKAKFAFTIAAVNIPPRLNFTVTAGHTGWIGAIPNDNLRNVSYQAVGTPSELTLHRRELRIGTALDIGESSILTIALTSPDLVGTMTIIANVVANCDFIPNKAGHEFMAGLSRNDRRNRDMHTGVIRQDIGEVCGALQRGANVHAYSQLGNHVFEGFKNRMTNLKTAERIVRILLSAGADPTMPQHDSPPYINSNALHAFATSRHDMTGIFQILLTMRVNQAGRNHIGYSPVMVAIESRQDPPTNFDYLLFGGAPPYKYIPLNRRAVLSGKGHYKKSALHIAIGKVQQLHKIESLLIAGANVNWQDSEGWTPLMYAINYRNEAAVRALLTRRHDLTVENSDGETAYQMARVRNLRKIKCLLLAHQEREVDSCSQFM